MKLKDYLKLLEKKMGNVEVVKFEQRESKESSKEEVFQEEFGRKDSKDIAAIYTKKKTENKIPKEKSGKKNEKSKQGKSKQEKEKKQVKSIKPKIKEQNVIQYEEDVTWTGADHKIVMPEIFNPQKNFRVKCKQLTFVYPYSEIQLEATILGPHSHHNFQRDMHAD